MKLKLKTRKSAAKRIKCKKNVFARKKAYKGHLLRKKNSKQLRTLSQPAQIHFADVKTFNLMIPYN
jgi:large subunit ribosomal protein L35